MKRNNWIGLILFLFFIFIEWSKLHPVEASFLFSVLCLIPFTLDLIDTKKRDGKILTIAKYIKWSYPVAAICGLLAFLLDSLLFTVVWLLFTGLVALLGVRRLVERGWKPIGETCIDFGLIYLFIRGCWLLAYIGEWEVLGFSGLIVLLTANHFQYSAFFLPIIVGLFNRKVPDWPVTLVVMVSQMTIALGITYSRTFELLAVSILFLALFRFCYKVWNASFMKKWAKWLFRASASLLLMTITFALLYVIGTFRGKIILSIPQMIWIHGIVNAFGVIFLGLLSLRIEKMKPIDYFYGKPMSEIVGTWRIGGDFLLNKGYIDERQYSGVVDEMKVFSSNHFQAEKLAPTITDFYENTLDYEFQARITWKKWFWPFAFVYERFSRRVQQIHLGVSLNWQRMTGELVGVNSVLDGRSAVRAWIRRNEQSETIFVALYSWYKHNGESYMNIALPLPFANMTGILRPYNQGENLLLTSVMRQSGVGDEGIYLRTRLWKVRLPLAETFVITEVKEGKLAANHEMWIGGLKFLQIDYKIHKK